MHPSSLFSLSDHLSRLSKDGDPLEVLDGTVDFERFRDLLVDGLGYSNGAKGGRPSFDPVSMFTVLVVQAQHNLSDARMEFMIRDRLSWMRFFGFDLGASMPDENTIRHYRNRLTQSGTLERLMEAFDRQLREQGYLAMGGQIVDAHWFLPPSSVTPKRRRPRSRTASQPMRSGRTSRPRHTRRMSMRAGRSRSAARCVIVLTERRCRRLPPRCLATSPISASIGATGSSARQR